MVRELDAEHVVDLALQPVGRGVDGGRGGGLLAFVDLELDADALVALEAVEDVDDVEARSRLRPVDGGDVDEVVETRSSLRNSMIGITAAVAATRKFCPTYVQKSLIFAPNSSLRSSTSGPSHGAVCTTGGAFRRGGARRVWPPGGQVSRRRQGRGRASAGDFRRGCGFGRWRRSGLRRFRRRRRRGRSAAGHGRLLFRLLRLGRAAGVGFVWHG